MEIQYFHAGDDYIPNLELPEESRPIGKWGRMLREAAGGYTKISKKLKKLHILSENVLCECHGNGMINKYFITR